MTDLRPEEQNLEALEQPRKEENQNKNREQMKKKRYSLLQLPTKSLFKAWNCAVRLENLPQETWIDYCLINDFSYMSCCGKGLLRFTCELAIVQLIRRKS